MTPINVAILWHQHQPFYYSDAQGKFLLPWVRLHATKDYLEMVQHLERHPPMRATINLVPSLLKQLDLYESGTLDTLLEVCRKPTSSLTSAEKHIIIRECFHADRDRLIARSHRYMELLEQHTFHETWIEQDFRDLIVHYHLAWTGEFERNKELLLELLAQDRNFTEEQKELLFITHDLILQKIIPLHKQLADAGQIELTTSPMYHPILPLLCNIGSAHDTMPHAALPRGVTGNIISANAHLTGAVLSHEARFGVRPVGIWPSEGSISDQTLDLMIQHGFSWTASDEVVLNNSINHRNNADMPHDYGSFEKYFPRIYSKDGKKIVVFFRDHRLSDKIGFDYQRMSADDAVADFVTSIERIRSDIYHKFGEEVLAEACVSVILDGENCWEYYQNNGFEFLDKCYTALTANPHIRPITFSNYLEEYRSIIRPIRHIVAGSWIYGNFKIWVGHPEKNRAWELLADAWKLEAGGDEVAFDSPLARAEGSDWFWWYGDDHVSGQKPIFDQLFREHLQAVYLSHGLEVPSILKEPILLQARQEVPTTYGSMHRAEDMP